MQRIVITSRRPNDTRMNPDNEWRYRSKLEDVNLSLRDGKITRAEAEEAARTVISRWQAVEPATEFVIVWEV